MGRDFPLADEFYAGSALLLCNKPLTVVIVQGRLVLQFAPSKETTKPYA